jgi:hypothetical protein
MIVRSAIAGNIQGHPDRNLLQRIDLREIRPFAPCPHQTGCQNGTSREFESDKSNKSDVFEVVKRGGDPFGAAHTSRKVFIAGVG